MVGIGTRQVIQRRSLDSESLADNRCEWKCDGGIRERRAAVTCRTDQHRWALAFVQQRRWSGTGTVSGGGPTVSFALTFDANGNLSTGTIGVSGDVELFSVLDLQSFSLGYESGGWNLTAQATVAGSPISVALADDGTGVITGHRSAWQHQVPQRVHPGKCEPQL